MLKFFLHQRQALDTPLSDITAEVSSAVHPSGYIGLQRFKNGVIKFKNITITQL